MTGKGKWVTCLKCTRSGLAIIGKNTFEAMTYYKIASAETVIIKVNVYKQSGVLHTIYLIDDQ